MKLLRRSRANEVRHAAEAADGFWRETAHLTYTGPRKERIARSALLIDLLTYGPSGAVIAAPTSSIPERVGGDWNADYRFSWVRDTSLALAVLAALGDTNRATQYMDWLAHLEAALDAPLQVLYRGRWRIGRARDRAHRPLGLSQFLARALRQ